MLFRSTAVDLNIDIHDLGSIVTTKLAIMPNVAAGGAAMLHLDGRGLELQSISVDGKPLADADYSHDESGVQIVGLTGACVVETIAKCHPENNTALEGLYLSGGMYCTQCEPEGFRRIGFYPDRPDVMSIFTVRLEAARAYPQLLSNGNLMETGHCGTERHFAIWHDPHKKPSYLCAIKITNDCCE